MPLQIELTTKTTIPLELEGITPDTVRELDLGAVERMEVFEGNNKTVLADFCRVSGTTEDGHILFLGELSGVHWIGTKMASGQITIEGNVGRHVGSEMSGGRIDVIGNCSDWVGAEMKGGSIHVRGSAGHLVGAAYRGSLVGMRGGSIIVNGDAGNEIGLSMGRGKIAIGGAIGDLAGFSMRAGTIVVRGASGIRHGAGMIRGTMIFLSEDPPEMLPTYRSAGRQSPLVFNLLAKEFRGLGFEHADLLANSEFQVYSGDQLEGGRGEIFVRQQKN